MIRTGSIGIDIALGGGWQPGTLNEVWGDTGSAKTVLAKHSAENAIRARKDVLWIDLDGAVRYMDDAPGLLLARPRNAEQAFMMAWHACQVPEVGLIVFDPAQLLVRQRELDGDPDFTPHPQREYRVELNELKRVAHDNGTVVLFCSQPRDKQREPVRGTGISEKVAYRVHLHADTVHQDGTREIVASVKDVAMKSTQLEAVRFTVIPRSGIDTARELVDVGIHYELVRAKGSWLSYGQIRAQGRAEMATALRRSPGMLLRLMEDVKRAAGIS